MSALQQVLDFVVSMKGQRSKVVDIYNTYTPRPRGYKVKYSDMLCATFVSSIFIHFGWTDIVPPECGAPQLFQNMKNLGRSIVDKNRVPNVGDLIFFGNSGRIQHVGIVTEVQGKQIYYYDIQSTVGRHTCPVGYAWTYGYGMPDYAKKDHDPTPPTPPTPTPTFKVGDLVKIKEGAKWYTGASIKSSVMAQNWYIYAINGDRVVINQNEKKTSAIMSPIHDYDLELVNVQTQPQVPAQEETVSITLQFTKSQAEALYAKAQAKNKTLRDLILSLV